LVGRTWIYFCASPALYGFIMFGESDDLDLRDICQIIERELEEATVHAAYLDAKRLEGLKPAALVRLGETFTRRREAMKKSITRVAMVQPPAFLGALFAGLHVVLPRPVPSRRFSTAADALAWLKWDDHSLVSRLDQLVLAVTGTSAVLSSLRKVLEERPGQVALNEAARIVGLSPRSLQRHLKEAGRSFRSEAAEAQIRVAQRLLTDTEEKLVTVATRIGSSPQHFSALFRKVSGESPRRWRERSRGSG
jgi:AraC-like DNA-binding protein